MPLGDEATGQYVTDNTPLDTKPRVQQTPSPGNVHIR